MNKGILAALFDFSFTEFVTLKFIKILYIVLMILSGLGALVLLGNGFSQGFTTGLVMLIIAPLAFLLYVFFARIWCELIIVLFRIAENTGRMVETGAKPAPAPAAPAAAAPTGTSTSEG